MFIGREKELVNLLEKGNFFPYPKKAFVIFSKSGFTKSAVTYAKEFNIQLVRYVDMFV